MKYTAMLACGNYNGVIGFAKAKAPAVPIALQKVSGWFFIFGCPFVEMKCDSRVILLLCY